MQWMEVKKGSAKAVRSFKRRITKRRIFATCGSNRPRLKYGHSENHNLQRTMEKAETFNGVLAASEKEAEAFFKRASEYYDKGNYDRAIADFTEAIRLKPDFVEAYQGRGDAYASGWTNITDLEHHRDRADAAIRAVLPLAVTTFVPSWEKAAELTKPVCPLSSMTGATVPAPPCCSAVRVTVPAYCEEYLRLGEKQ